MIFLHISLSLCHCLLWWKSINCCFAGLWVKGGKGGTNEGVLIKNMCKVVKSCLAHYAFYYSYRAKTLLCFININLIFLKVWKIIDLFFSLLLREMYVPWWCAHVITTMFWKYNLNSITWHRESQAKFN